MPKYVLPKPTKDEKEIEMSDMFYPRYVHLPANKSIINALEIGDGAEITLKGVVKKLSAREKSADFEIELRSIEAYPLDTSEPQTQANYEASRKG